MPDITDLMNNYRECARNLWNTYFRIPNPRQSQVDDAFGFDKINELLFNELVLNKIGKAHSKKKHAEPWPFLTVNIVAKDCPGLIGKSSEGGGKYWDENRITKNAVLQFISYFDWDEFDYIDYRYYKVKIISFPEFPQFAGADALIETCYARIYLRD